MITVRFPSGFSVQYNDATTVDPLPNGGHDIIRREPRKWFARVPADCIVEGVNPCRTYNASGPNSQLTAEVQVLQRRVASLTRAINKIAKGGK